MLLAAAGPLLAQNPSLDVDPGNRSNGWRAAVRPVGVLSDSALIRPLQAGLVLRFHFDLELWHDRAVTDALEDRATWSLTLHQEPLSRQYRLTRSWDPDGDEWFDSLEAAARALDRWYLGPIRPPARSDRRYYYDVQLEVEILSLGDLAELEHWLRGEVGGPGDVGGAITRGLKRLFIRLIGLSARTFRARTESFAAR